MICDILGAFKRDAKPGVYVDVGANEPKRFSNTWRLYELGWSGIAVEPDRDLCRRFVRVRSRDAVVCAALGEREEDLVFHRFYESALNTLDPAMAARAESQGWLMMSREQLRCVRSTRYSRSTPRACAVASISFRSTPRVSTLRSCAGLISSDSSPS